MRFLSCPPPQLEYEDYSAHEAGLARARGSCIRANRYALEAFELTHPGFREGIFTDTEALMNDMTVEDVPLLYWTAASWLSALFTTFEDLLPTAFSAFVLPSRVADA